jgi:hypothetical protein
MKNNQLLREQVRDVQTALISGNRNKEEVFGIELPDIEIGRYDADFPYEACRPLKPVMDVVTRW